MARQVIEERRSPQTLAKDFGVSPQTVFRWLKRYRQEGERGLTDRSSRPHTIPNRYPPPTEELKKALFAALHTPRPPLG